MVPIAFSPTGPIAGGLVEFVASVSVLRCLAHVPIVFDSTSLQGMDKSFS